ncbi:hypothetical protein E2I00_019743, partial [Balaenoptera physalus]
RARERRCPQGQGRDVPVGEKHLESKRSQLEEKEKKFPMFKAVEFKSQVVAGMVFFIKVQVDEDNFVHIRAFESLPHEKKPLAL